MIITSEYVYDDIKLNDARNIIENTLLEYERKYGADYHRSEKVECVAEFLNEKKNETKNITIERYNIIRELNKIMQWSKGMIKLITTFELEIIIKRRIHKDVLHLYPKSEVIPILWINFFIKIANNRPKRFLQHCRERHFCHFQ